ncbi:MAG: PKD domain-containing protein [Saprospiraceae bacterium]
MRNIYLLLFIAVGNVLFSQKANDFTVKDIKGIEYNLFEILSTNRHVLLDVSATWCGPCWSFKKTGVMESYMSKYGPEGTDDAMVFFVEGDATTNMQDLLGQTSASQGNWVEGTNFPIIDNAAVGTLFGVTAFPTIMVVCPDRTIKKVGSRTLTGIENEAKTCGKISGASEPDFRSDLRDGCGLLDVQFFDNSWPRPTNYLWDFGDGTTSTEKNPSHNYNQNGVYSVKLNVRNEFGENTLTKNDFISIGSGFEKPVQSLGPIDHKFATGRYFEGGHHSLIIDAHKPFILHSAKVCTPIAIWIEFSTTCK